MKNKTNQSQTIGEMIEREVRKQEMPIKYFAEQINCTRVNAYEIFKRDNISLLQLKQISTVLGRNFFADLAADLDLIDLREESAAEARERKAVDTFLKIAPEVLTEMGKPYSIDMNWSDNVEEDLDSLPDFLLTGLFITFTIGKSLQERMEERPMFSFETLTNDEGCTIEVCMNKAQYSYSINIPITEKTRDEWRATLRFAFDVYAQVYPEYDAEKGVHVR